MSSTSILRGFIILAGAVLALAAGVATAGAIITVPVGDALNAADTTTYGAVSYQYSIGKYEVTSGQYTEFLNAVAATDAHGLYSLSMDDVGSQYAGCGIQRSGGSGNYEYTVASDWANRPVNYVSWGDAARFANWLHNGKPTGLQSVLTTERGSYDLNGATSQAALMAVNRSDTATWVIPTENEWYKAAYYDPNKGGAGVPGYWDYAMKSDSTTIPSNDLTTPDGGNNANHYITGDWSIGPPYYKTEVGDFENSKSAYNTFDQCGNVWEWNEAVISSMSYRGWRGGDYERGRDYMLAGYRGSINPTFEYQDGGFRVALVPEPGTLVMLGAASLAGLIWWRRRK